jgi:Ca-activated chloride channel family protein
MQLARPDMLWLLWLLPVLIGLEVFALRRARRRILDFAQAEAAERLGLLAHGRQKTAKLLLLFASLAALILAAIGVRLGFRWEEIHRRGLDIVLALDVSSSMQAQDGGAEDRISRLTRAKREVNDLLRMLKGDRVGLVAFAGAAFVECPLTIDYGAVQMFLDSLDGDTIALQGTDLGAAVEASLKAFPEKSSSQRAVVVISDGENLQGDLDHAVEAAKQQGVRIFALGIGQPSGAPIPRDDGGFKRDRHDDVVMTRLDEGVLKKIALASGGLYVHAVPGDEDWQEIYEHGIKSRTTEADFGSQRRRLWHERYQWFAAMALLALTLEALLPERRRNQQHHV